MQKGQIKKKTKKQKESEQKAKPKPKVELKVKVKNKRNSTSKVKEDDPPMSHAKERDIDFQKWDVHRMHLFLRL